MFGNQKKKKKKEQEKKKERNFPRSFKTALAEKNISQCANSEYIYLTWDFIDIYSDCFICFSFVDTVTHSNRGTAQFHPLKESGEFSFLLGPPFKQN